MKEAWTGLAAIVFVCLIGEAFAQTNTPTPTAMSGGGYFVRFGEAATVTPARRNLIPPPSAPLPEHVPQAMFAAATTADGMVLNPANPGAAAVAEPAAGSSVAIPASGSSFAAAVPTAAATLPTPAQLAPQNPQPVAALRPDLPIATRANAMDTSFAPMPGDMPLDHNQPMRLSQVTRQPSLTSPTAFDSFRKSTLTSAQPAVSPLITGCEDCDGGCEAIECGPICCGAAWEHFTTIWAAAVYMRPRNADVSYAVPIDGPISTIASNPIQVGQVALVDSDYDTGYDVGFNLAINALTSVAVEYLTLDSSTSDQVSTSAPNVLRSLVSHPSSTSAAADFLTASASLGIELELLDLSLRHLFVGGDVFAVNYSVGARYGRLEQDFSSIFFDNGSEQVQADVDFDGAGLRLGLETERRACNHCVHFYSRAAASFLAGKFQTHYLQGQTFDPTVVTTRWEAGRVVPILDLELGGGWSTKCGRLKLRAGYVFSAWFNTVKTDDFIQAVQQNHFNGLSDTLTFDGVVGRAEFCF